jgi:hypothetical protein
MTQSVWNGATADITTAADWSPVGVPGAGALGIVPSGTVLVAGLALEGFTLWLRPAAAGDAPTLALSNASLGAGMHVAAAGTGAVLSIAGTDSNAGTIGLLFAHDNAQSLAITLNSPNAELVNTGSITARAGATIAISNGQVVNEGQIATNGGTLVVQSQLTGVGTLSVDGGQADIDSIVGSGQTVDFSGGLLVLDDPHQFLGTLMGWDAAGTLELAHTTITGASLSGGVLTLTDGTLTEAQIHVGGGFSLANLLHPSVTASGNTLLTLAPGSPPA